MSKQNSMRKYGKQNKKPQANRLFVELPLTPNRVTRASAAKETPEKDAVKELTKNLSEIQIQDENEAPKETTKRAPKRAARKSKVAEPVVSPEERKRPPTAPETQIPPEEKPKPTPSKPQVSKKKTKTAASKPAGSSGRKRQSTAPETQVLPERKPKAPASKPRASPKRKTKTPAQPQTPQVATPPPSATPDTVPGAQASPTTAGLDELRVLTWDEVCPPGDAIEKIAEASYAEVYRVTNARGTSIIKAIRMESAVAAMAGAQRRAGLVDEQPHRAADLRGELQISEWLADVPGFVVYKERYVVRGRACPGLLATHRAFHRRLRRQDPGRLQFYPGPARYLAATRFLVVELGDAGPALEDFPLVAAAQLWDVFFHVAIALARAEAQIEFEHRDLHEGNLCIRQVGEPAAETDRDGSPRQFGYSGLEITILDYGLSRACAGDGSPPVAYDLERDLSLFASEHAPQCRVYRQMRSFLLRGDRVCLPPRSHQQAYAEGVDGPISWARHEPYTNVLWLAYTYQWMTGNFRGPKKELNAFRRLTREFWSYLDPEADNSVPGFESASDVVRFAVEAGWIEEDQLMGGRDEVEKSILSILTYDDRRPDDADGEMDRSVRRSPRKHRTGAA
ncbi:hypothetical protein F4780DRAFT_787325 [Xylariomycetidae sp. FL0641]|nr:hypothetical protein F4780DRAFT_787325 [Xylariomycetidae sp. FL0641]